MSYAADQPARPPSAHPQAQTVAARVHRRAPEAATPALRYQGLVTRGIAFALDAGVINVVSLLVAIGAALILSVLDLPQNFEPALAAIGGVSYVVWTVAYFVTFWSSTGQTPGNRVMEIRVVRAEGGTLTVWRALFRFGALILAALPFFLGFLPILLNERRRGLQDMLAGTVVVDSPDMPEVRPDFRPA
jgi:uncharacterized RDD family membrane protein YckC